MSEETHETEGKSLNSLASNSGHSRRSSDTSEVSETTTNSYDDPNLVPDDLWNVWGELVNDWPNQYKKRAAFVKVIDCFPPTTPLSEQLFIE